MLCVHNNDNGAKYYIFRNRYNDLQLEICFFTISAAQITCSNTPKNDDDVSVSMQPESYSSNGCINFVSVILAGSQVNLCNVPTKWGISDDFQPTIAPLCRCFMLRCCCY